MIIVDNILQSSPEWFQEKLGKPSASNMDRILTPGGKPSTSRQAYLFELAAERIRGKAVETYQSPAMAEGKLREQESRLLYELLYDVEVEQVGVIYQDETRRYLCSPDGLIKRQHGLELKNVLPKTQAGYLYYGKLPSDYFVQVQSSMLIAGFTRWDFFSYCPDMAPFHLKVERDWDYTAKLKVALDAFCAELDKVEEQLRKLA